MNIERTGVEIEKDRFAFDENVLSESEDEQEGTIIGDDSEVGLEEGYIDIYMPEDEEEFKSIVSDFEREKANECLTSSDSSPGMASRLAKGFVDKLQVHLGLTLSDEVSRQVSLAKVVASMESVLFNPDAFAEYDVETQRKLYKEAKGALNDSLETQRKFIVQNKDLLFREADGGVERKVLNDLMALPPESLKRIEEAIAEEKAVSIPEPDDIESAIDDSSEEI